MSDIFRERSQNIVQEDLLICPMYEEVIDIILTEEVKERLALYEKIEDSLYTVPDHRDISEHGYLIKSQLSLLMLLSLSCLRTIVARIVHEFFINMRGFPRLCKRYIPAHFWIVLTDV